MLRRQWLYCDGGAQCECYRGVRGVKHRMPILQTTVAGSLPKPSWLAEPNKLWPTWRAGGGGCHGHESADDCNHVPHLDEPSLQITPGCGG